MINIVSGLAVAASTNNLGNENVIKNRMDAIEKTVLALTRKVGESGGKVLSHSVIDMRDMARGTYLVSIMYIV